MSTNCDRCGYRDNEVKSGSAISDKGKRIILKVEDREDLSRDILKVIHSVDLTSIVGTMKIKYIILERYGGNDHPGDRSRAYARHTRRKIHYSRRNIRSGI